MKERWEVRHTQEGATRPLDTQRFDSAESARLRYQQERKRLAGSCGAVLLSLVHVTVRTRGEASQPLDARTSAAWVERTTLLKNQLVEAERQASAAQNRLEDVRAQIKFFLTRCQSLETLLQLGEHMVRSTQSELIECRVELQAWKNRALGVQLEAVP